jgi:hypothetical protein
MLDTLAMLESSKSKQVYSPESTTKLNYNQVRNPVHLVYLPYSLYKSIVTKGDLSKITDYDWLRKNISHDELVEATAFNLAISEKLFLSKENPYSGLESMLTELYKSSGHVFVDAGVFKRSNVEHRVYDLFHEAYTRYSSLDEENTVGKEGLHQAIKNSLADAPLHTRYISNKRTDGLVAANVEEQYALNDTYEVVNLPNVTAVVFYKGALSWLTDKERFDKLYSTFIVDVLKGLSSSRDNILGALSGKSDSVNVHSIDYSIYYAFIEHTVRQQRKANVI